MRTLPILDSNPDRHRAGPVQLRGPAAFGALADSGLGLTEAEIAHVFEPFIVQGSPGSAEAWAREVARRKRKLAKATARRLLFGWLPAMQRRESAILREYDKAWGAIDYGTYSLEARQTEHTPWQWRGRRMFASDVGATRFRQLLLIQFIERLRPRQVLEVGCGNGINLILLAGRFPEVAFAGIELTEAGHRAARSLQEHSDLPPSLRAYAPLPLARSDRLSPDPLLPGQRHEPAVRRRRVRSRDHGARRSNRWSGCASGRSQRSRGSRAGTR